MDEHTMLHRDLCQVLYTREEIARRVEQLGAEITRDYQGKRPIMVCILKGAVLFYSDLLRQIPLPLEMDFMAISSYGSGTSSLGQVEIKKDLDRSIEGRDVIIVEDIVDSGLTLSQLQRLFLLRGPASVRVVTLLNKPSRRRVALEPDYCGFEIEDCFVVGYGMDYAERYRNLPVIGVLKPEVYAK